ncbi:MAG: hypothetical protein HC837_12675 [Chloroflexaceae bacterium]|nr:hypothetical protein [Chloroflexaceae bacterium]
MSYWSIHGLNLDGLEGFSYAESLALFGSPISTPTNEIHGRSDAGLFLTQWFERARLQYDARQPANAPTAIFMGRIGMELYSIQGIPIVNDTPEAPTDGQPPATNPPTGPAPDAPEESTPAPAPSVCEANAPALTDGAQAWMVETNVSTGNDATVCTSLTLNSSRVSGAEVEGVVIDDNGENRIDTVVTASNGFAEITIGTNNLVGEVVVAVTMRYNEMTYTANTSFTLE